VEPNHPQLSIAKQCELAGISRATFYYRSQKKSDEPLMRKIDEVYTKCPFYGGKRITKQLHRDGLIVNHKRVERVMKEMGIEGLRPKKNTSKRHPQHPVFPYLLKGLNIQQPNQVWSTDITYLRLHDGWLYLVALLDWHSRYVLSWQLSESLHSDFCVRNLKQALEVAQPQIHNSDQGRQFTAFEYVAELQHKHIQISMDGRGRCHDNIMTERLWRTVKYEEVYLKEYRSPQEARASLMDYFRFYNEERLHQSLNYRTPAEVYFNP
jgi:putative transposase